MKLIIDIDEDYYKAIWENGYIYDEDNEDIAKIIKDGTPLPKGHGDLIDRDKLVYDCSLGDGGCDHICRCDGCSYNIIRETTINKATPIIEADKGE